jgi:TPR repeat protein
VGEFYRTTGQLNEAAPWYGKAADQGHAEAAWRVAQSLRSGQQSDERDREALKWIRFAADNFVGEAQAELADMYAQGVLGKKDLAEAFSWTERAADEHVPRAQSRLGLMYLNGTGTKRNLEQAIRYLRLAAERDEPDAENQLGVMYIRGDGVPQNLVSGVQLCLKSAAHGNAGALVAAGLAIEASPKIPGETSISSRLAFAWALFDAASSLGRAEAAAERDRVGAKLPPEVLARAKTMASELKAKVGSTRPVVP